MTAASTELPLPTYVQVTNLLNGKKVIVKVNDRGPFRCHRVLDLSYAAAKKLGFAGRGTAPVRVVAIDPRTYNQPSHHYAANCSNQKAPSGLYLQVGAYSKLASARAVSANLTHYTKNPVRIARRSNLYSVQVGPLASSDQRDDVKRLLKKNGFQNVISISI